jgi:hypothetical protein
MNTSPENPKLVELRSKTDRQLVELIGRGLDRAACCARARQFHGQAARLCDEIRQLLPFVPRHDRRRLESRLAEIAEILCPSAQVACF